MTIVGYLYLLSEIILCIILIFFLASMFLIVYKQNSRDRTLAKQLHFHHRVVKVQTRRKSAVKWVVLVTFMFLLCYGIFLRCNVLFLTGHKCKALDCCGFSKVTCKFQIVFASKILYWRELRNFFKTPVTFELIFGTT